MAAGTATPNPPVINAFVTLNLDVIFNDDVDLVGLNVAVLLTALGSSNPMTLYAADFKSNAPGAYGAGDEYEDTLSWPIPSFAPYGHYAV